jgi:hypothetical protein
MDASVFSHLENVIAPAVVRLTSGALLSHADRMAAEAACDRVKRSPNGLDVALQFFRALLVERRRLTGGGGGGNGVAGSGEGLRPFMAHEAVQHFLLQVVLFGVVNGWNDFPEAQKARVKEEAIAVLLPYCATGPGPHLLQKVADVVAELAKREWPQRWPDFHRRLIQMAGQGPHAAHAVAATLANLSEDSTNPEHQMRLPAKRRTQVRLALPCLLPSLPRDCMLAAGLG